MKLYKTASIKTPIGYFIIGFSLKSFAMGIRIDKYGIVIDAFPLWVGWER
jgi:hypothetical protein